MMDRLAKSFHDKVEEFLSEDEREDLFSALHLYQEKMDIGQFVLKLKSLVSHPGRMRLFDDLRPLIPLKHQMVYDRLVPNRGSDKLKVVHLKVKAKERLGFAVKGGLEHGVGVFVSEVTPGSQAEQQGLKVGDEIVRLNGFTIKQAIHEEVLNLIKARSQLILKVKRIGMIPVKRNVHDPVSWVYADYADPAKAVQQLQNGNKYSLAGMEIKLVISLLGNASLGCSIFSGPAEKPGIFIQSIKSGSLAEEAGLQVGDQILSVNHTRFHNISHSEAVVAMKVSRQMQLVIRKGEGVEFFTPPPVCLTPEQVDEQINLLNHPASSADLDNQHDTEYSPRNFMKQNMENKENTSEDDTVTLTEYGDYYKVTSDFLKVVPDLEADRTEQQSVTMTIDQQTDISDVEKDKDETHVKRNASVISEQTSLTSTQLSVTGRNLRQNYRPSQESPERRIGVQKANSTESREPSIAGQNYASREWLDRKPTIQKAYSTDSYEGRSSAHNKTSIYTSHVGTPNFRIQKPVLLSRVDDKSGPSRAGSLDKAGLSHAGILDRATSSHAGSLDRATSSHAGSLDRAASSHAGSVGKCSLTSGSVANNQVESASADKKPARCGPVDRGVIRTAIPPAFPIGSASVDSHDTTQPSTSLDDINSILQKADRIGGRQILTAIISKDGPLEISLDGGANSPLDGGRVVISEVHKGGAVHRHGGIHGGDHLLMVDDVSLLNVTLSSAQDIISSAMMSRQHSIKLIVAKTPPRKYEEEILWSHSLPTSNSGKLHRQDGFRMSEGSLNNHDDDDDEDEVPISFI